MSLERADFPAFFAAVRPGQSPFAWQERLLDRLLTAGRWPDRIVAPTGSGKTAVVDVHVFANALGGAGVEAVRVPRRLSLVVDRRVLVDSHAEHAAALAARIDSASRGILGAVRDGLRALRVDPGPDRPTLVTARLRGGSPSPRRWRDEVDACAVLTCTPDMWGSRVLFRGYGSSRRAWPREAGLLAFDAALVVDEAHLSRQLLTTARRVTELQSVAPRPVGVPCLQVVETTATPDEAGRAAASVGVEAGDLDLSATLADRMRRPKPVSVVGLDVWPVPARGPARKAAVSAVADAVERMVEAHGSTVGCVLNTVAFAVEVDGELRRRKRVTALLVGRLRPYDVAQLRARRPGLLDLRGDRSVDVLVATQTVEVGIDIDLSAMVTELAPGTALAQRAGRVNRVGTRESGPVVVVGPVSGPVGEQSGPYGVADLEAALEWVTARAADPAGVAPWALRGDPPPAQASSRLAGHRLELADSWLVARTSSELFADPDLDLWLSDNLDRDTDVGLVARLLPADTAGAIDQVRLLPPRAHEVFPTAIGRAKEIVASVAAAADPAGPILRVRYDGVTVLDSESDVRPGDSLVLPAGSLLTTGNVPDVTGQPAADVLETGARLVARHGADDASLRIGDGSHLPAPTDATDEMPLRLTVAGVLSTFEEITGQPTGADRRLLAAGLGNVVALLEPGPLRSAVEATVALLGRVRDSDVVRRVDGDTVTGLVVVDQRRAIADEDARQTWSPAGEAVALADHQRDVGTRAGRLAARLGVADDLASSLRRAGELHDEGKRDGRFQTMLRGAAFDRPPRAAALQGGTELEVPLAKSARRTPLQDRRARDASGVPSGWRHEQLSAVRAWVAGGTDRDLVARLVGTTHGHGRPTFPDDATGLLDGDDADRAAAVDLFDVGIWDSVVEATDIELGAWGTAFLEAVLRAADGSVSAGGGTAAEPTGGDS